MKRLVQLGLLLSLVALGGCRLLNDPPTAEGHSPLRPSRPSPDSVTMETIWARFSPSDARLTDAAWQEIDETRLDPAARRELANNGFRAGVISGTLPDALARALNAGQEQTSDATANPPDGNKPRDDAAAAHSPLLVEPAIQGRIRQFRRNQRHEIQASEVHATMPLLVNENRELRGRSYHAAQAVYALKVDPRPNRMVLVEMVPEIHHGAPRLRWTGGDDGIWRQAPLREREVFERLRMSVELAPGEMLVLMALPDASSRLGHYFHTVEATDGRSRKLILIRVAEVPPSDTFAALR